MKTGGKSVFAFVCVVLVLGCALQAEEECPIEIKLLLAPQTMRTAFASLGFENKAEGQVYFFDTEQLDLLRQGVIVRIRQGANNDLTVKVRVPESNKNIEASQLGERFPCEIDRTAAGENISYSVRRTFKVQQVSEMGTGIRRLLGPTHKSLLQDTGASIDWAKVKRIANIRSTKWQSRAQSRFRSLTLELWEWPEGEILELSTKVQPGEGGSKNAELQEIVRVKHLSLSASQGTKTRSVLEAISEHSSIAGCR
jgi:hypothetical protein